MTLDDSANAPNDRDRKAPSGVVGSEHGDLSPSQTRRRNRATKLLFATVLTGIFVTIVMWSRGVFQPTPAPPVLAIAPSVLFEQICRDIDESGGDKLHVTEFAVDDTMVDPLSSLDSVDTVIFDQGAVTDAAIETIAGLPKLMHLRLRLSPITDAGLKRLADVETLWYLNLPHADCTAEGVAELARLPRLRQLRLGSSKLGNDVTRAIASIDSLRGIHLIGVPVTDEGLKTLAGMQHLESLYLDDCAVTEAGWEWLFREHPGLHVHVDQIHHDRDPKAHPHH